LAWSVGSPARPDRVERRAIQHYEDPVVVEIANRQEFTAVVVSNGLCSGDRYPIPFSINPGTISNVRSVVEDPLNDREMEALSRIDRNCRRIKGDVFLWKENQTWEALWDVNGEITPA
jgi:hypothetical protein